MGYRRNSVDAPKSLSAFQKKNRPQTTLRGEVAAGEHALKVERNPWLCIGNSLKLSVWLHSLSVPRGREDGPRLATQLLWDLLDWVVRSRL